MRALVLLAVLAPESPDPDLAVVWHREAKASAQLQQRVRVALASEVGVGVEAVRNDATAFARDIVGREVPRAAVEAARALGEGLDAVEEEFRAGQLGPAAPALAQLRREIESAPILPGIEGLAWREAMLSARIAWAMGDVEATDRALGRALALDPSVTLSSRDVPPTLAARFETLRMALTSQRATWPVPAVESDRGGEGEIELIVDGSPGRRAVPPGSHFLVAHRPGRAPVAAYVDVSRPWVPPDSEFVLPDSMPASRETAERVCAALELEWLVLAHRRDVRVGLQAYRCGSGYGARWVGTEAALAEGAASVLGPAGKFEGKSSRLEDAWPQVIEPRNTDPSVEPPTKKPWYRRAWVWVVVGGVVAAGVTTGAVLGTQGSSDGVGVHADDFLQP